jgi:O-antigen/teichoic acid export membrane protein
VRVVRRLRLRTRRAYGWGLADSAFASAANLALSLLAGRILGPHGLGILVIGFSLYLLMVSVQRSLVSTPLVSGSTVLDADERRHATRSALAVLIASGVLVTAGVVVVGVAIGGAIGRGLLVFAPWLIASVLQDFWRAILFRDGRAGAAAANTSLRLVGLAVTAPFAIRAGTEFAIAASWGAGFALAAGVGFAQTRVVPAHLGAAFRWWRARAWPFGKWLVAQEGVFNVMGYAITFALVAIVGAAALGGLRAAETVFAPFSLLAPAIALPGLPAVARALDRGADAARQLALRLSVAAVVLTILYFGTMLVIGEPLLEALYGADFGPYGELVVPIGMWQIATAAAIGFTLFLSAAQRGRSLLAAGLVGSVGQFSLMTLLAWTSGVRGAAWGLAAGTAVGSATAVALVRLPRRRTA